MWEQRERRRAEITALLSEIKHDNLVLDIGCGEGNMINMFADSAGFVVGLDRSLKALKKAKSRLIASNVDLCHGVAERLPFRSFYFDRILMLELLEHLPNPQACIKEADRCAKNNAVFVISVPWKEKIAYVHRGDSKLAPKWWGHIRSFNETDIVSLLPSYYRLLMKKHLPNAYIYVFTSLPLLKRLPLRAWLTINDALGKIKKGYWAIFKFRKLANK